MNTIPATARAAPSLAMAALLLLGGSAAAQTSALWGEDGERWTPEGRLPDFSFAGYRRGEEPFRIPAERISVSDYGAKGDGRTDDTAAFKKALAAGAGKLILLPPGRFVLGDVLEIRRSGTVLRGAGSDRTVLLFTKPLEELRPNPARTDGKQPTSGWSWGGGLVMIGGKEGGTARPVAVIRDERRGSRCLALGQHTFSRGDEVVLTVSDDADHSLLKHLYRDQTGDISGLKNWRCRQVFRVVGATGDVVVLDRGLRFDVRRAWKPTLAAFAPDITDSALEGVAFEFPATPYRGHFKEVGFNPVVIGSSAAHCWLRDLRIWNADSGPYVNGTFCTLADIRLGADPARRSTQGLTGHHGITLQGMDCLCTGFDIETQFIHDLTVQSAHGCVFESGRALNLCMDHHRWAPYENLFTDIDAGDGARLFQSSGGGERGHHTAAGETFWNLRTRQPAPSPKSLGNHAINVVGVGLRDAADKMPAGLWCEPIAPGDLRPQNLYRAMLRKRLEAGRAQ